MQTPAPRPNSFDDLVLTDFGEFAALTASVLLDAGFTIEEVCDALDPGNLRPAVSVTDDGQRVRFVPCPRCTARIPAADLICFNCGGPLNVDPSGDG